MRTLKGSDFTYEIIPVGDMGISVKFEQLISEEINNLVIALYEKMNHIGAVGILGVIPAYCSLLIYYEPHLITYDKLTSKIEKFLSEVQDNHQDKIVVTHIPVCYDGEYGPDLENVARHNHLTIDEVVNIHMNTFYRIYMLGFTPGFPYLGGMNKCIATPRLMNPRTKIPAGAVGIAGEQTGIYPLESPGGWQLVGRTPVKLFDPSRQNPFLLKAGNYIKFDRIDASAFNAILNDAEYQCIITIKDKLEG